MVTVSNGTRSARKTNTTTSEKTNRSQSDRATNNTTTSKAKTKTTNSNGNGKKQQLDSVDLAARIVNSVKKLYKVELADRDSRLVRKVAYALREKLGKDIQSQMEKNKRNGKSKQSFDWKQWNSDIFPKLVGNPENMTYSAETLAEVAVLIYDSIPSETSAAIESLVEFNLESLKARNNLNKNELDLDSLEDDENIDDFLDDDDDLEIEDKDDDDFELDDDDDDDDFDLDD
jgi:hypothetical protein